MSSSENQPSSPVFSFTFPAMALGTVTSAGAPGVAVLNENFLLGVSRVLGLVRKTSVAPGTPYIASIAVPAGGTAAAKTTTIVLNSSVNTDLSTYTLLWQNEVANVGQSTSAGSILGSSALVILPC